MTKRYTEVLLDLSLTQELVLITSNSKEMGINCTARLEDIPDVTRSDVTLKFLIQDFRQPNKTKFILESIQIKQIFLLNHPRSCL